MRYSSILLLIAATLPATGTLAQGEQDDIPAHEMGDVGELPPESEHSEGAATQDLDAALLSGTHAPPEPVQAPAAAPEPEQESPPAEPGPPEGGPISAAVLLGYGFTLNTGAAADTNALGLGLGVRAGYNFDALYLGATLLYHGGGSTDFTNVLVVDAVTANSTAELTSDLLILALQAGYDLPLENLVLRPSLEVGLGFLELTYPIQPVSSGYFLVSPGAALIAPLRAIGPIFVGLDLRLPIVFADEVLVGLDLLLSVGMRLPW